MKRQMRDRKVDDDHDDHDDHDHDHGDYDRNR